MGWLACGRYQSTDHPECVTECVAFMQPTTEPPLSECVCLNAWAMHAHASTDVEYLFTFPRHEKTSCHTLSQGLKESRIQSIRDSRTQALKDTKAQAFKDSRTQRLTDGKINDSCFAICSKNNHIRFPRIQFLEPPRAKHTKTSVPKHWRANINLDKAK